MKTTTQKVPWFTVCSWRGAVAWCCINQSANLICLNWIWAWKLNIWKIFLFFFSQLHLLQTTHYLWATCPLAWMKKASRKSLRQLSLSLYLKGRANPEGTYTGLLRLSKAIFQYFDETCHVLTPCRFAFVEFTTVDDAEKALQSSQNIQIKKRKVKIQFGEAKEKLQAAKGIWDWSCCIIHEGVTCCFAGSLIRLIC